MSEPKPFTKANRVTLLDNHKETAIASVFYLQRYEATVRELERRLEVAEAALELVRRAASQAKQLFKGNEGDEVVKLFLNINAAKLQLEKVCALATPEELDPKLMLAQRRGQRLEHLLHKFRGHESVDAYFDCSCGECFEWRDFLFPAAAKEDLDG